MQEKNPFSSLRYRQIESIWGRENTLKSKPAVYAWYRNLHFGDAEGTRERFLGKLNALLSARLSESASGRLGPFYHVSVHEQAGSLSTRKWEMLESIADNNIARSRLARILESATLLQAPLYVGKTKDLRQRIGEHIDGSSGLLERLKAAGIDLSACLLRFMYVTDEDIELIVRAANYTGVDPIEDVTLLVEDLPTRLGPSAFVRRPG